MENKIAFESKFFWVEKSEGKFLINLKVTGYSYLVGTKENLDSAKKFIEKAEKYPANLKFLLPKDRQCQFELFIDISR